MSTRPRQIRIIAAARALRIAVGVLVSLPAALAVTYHLFLILYAPPAGARADTRHCYVIDADRPTLLSDGTTLDDAGCPCAMQELASVELRIQTDPRDYSGHAYIHTPRMSLGFRTDEPNVGLIDYLWPWAPFQAGRVQDDTTHDYDFAVCYRACPQTIERLEESLIVHGDDLYQVGSWRGGRNCATWARDRLIDAGLSPPDGDCPNRIARGLYASDRPRAAGLVPIIAGDLP